MEAASRGADVFGVGFFFLLNDTALVFRFGFLYHDALDLLGRRANHRALDLDRGRFVVAVVAAALWRAGQLLLGRGASLRALSEDVGCGARGRLLVLRRQVVHFGAVVFVEFGSRWRQRLAFLDPLHNGVCFFAQLPVWSKRVLVPRFSTETQ